MTKRKKIFMIVCAALTLFILPLTIFIVMGQNDAKEEAPSNPGIEESTHESSNNDNNSNTESNNNEVTDSDIIKLPGIPGLTLKADYETTYKKVPTDGTTPADHNVYDNLAYALYKVTQAQEFKTVTTGKSTAAFGIKQDILDTRVVKNGCGMVSTITSGLVKKASQKFITADKALIRSGSVSTVDNVSWDNDTNPEIMSHADFINRIGWMPFQATPYIISEATIIDTPAVATENGMYSVSFSLDIDKAAFWYKYEVKENSGSAKFPDFKSVNMTMTMDNSFTIKQIKVKEIYKVSVAGITSKTTTENEMNFYYDNVEFDSASIAFFNRFTN